jgi:hypothetical protein
VWLFAPAPWRAAGYLFSYLWAGTALFSVAISVVAVAAGMGVTLLGLPLLVAAAHALRGMAQLERNRAGLITEPIPARYAPDERRGLLGRMRTRWTDRQTWRDTAYLVLLWPVLFVMDLVPLMLWSVCLAGAALPLYYWAMPQWWDGGTFANGVMIGYTPGPHNTFGDGGFGIWVGDLRTATIAAAVFAILSVPAGSLLIGTARRHAAVARLLLGPYVDPLADAKRVLAGPGPLAGLVSRPAMAAGS